ncbi:RraA family protein [Xenorhabdus khoisanae]|uniref:RraA family protein n=1 Tax=Xenorhabdus khoisanae TaxID=880157 RepID=UPI002358EFEB|nr:RraA family protein [Xenorhabdus khoisanae]MDC9615909.1 RraA family protein [Xenorhabdus khoisanae]
MDRRLSELSSSLLFDAHIRLGIEPRVLSYKLNPIFEKKIFGRCYNLKGATNVTNEQKLNSRLFFERIPEGSVIMIETGDSEGVGHWGELMSHAALKQGVRGVVVNGGCRDVEEIKKLSFPVYCVYSSPFESGSKYCIGEYEVDIELPGIDNSNIYIRHNFDFVFADTDGVIIIKEKNLDSIVEKAIEIRNNEIKTIQDIKDGIIVNEAFVKNNVV